jgi:hypothetical protein
MCITIHERALIKVDVCNDFGQGKSFCWFNLELEVKTCTYILGLLAVIWKAFPMNGTCFQFFMYECEMLIHQQPQ